MIDIVSRLEALAAAPKTHRVTMTYRCGKVRTFDAHCEAAARNHAASESRKIGRKLIDRDTGATVEMVAVAVAAL